MMSSFSSKCVLTLLFAVCSKTFAWQVPTMTKNYQHLQSRRSTLAAKTVLYSSSDNDIDANDPISRLPLMEAELATEVDDDKRVLLKERIADAKTSAEFGVRKAQFTFYDAFTNQDLTTMANLWSAADDIRCVHPGMASLDGPDNVMQSWAQIFEGGKAFSIQPSRTRIDVSGQTALCSCFEETPGGGMLECLNVYRREEGNWKMILHMASPVMIRQEEA